MSINKNKLVYTAPSLVQFLLNQRYEKEFMEIDVQIHKYQQNKRETNQETLRNKPTLKLLKLFV